MSDKFNRYFEAIITKDIFNSPKNSFNDIKSSPYISSYEFNSDSVGPVSKDDFVDIYEDENGFLVLQIDNYGCKILLCPRTLQKIKKYLMNKESL